VIGFIDGKRTDMAALAYVARGLAPLVAAARAGNMGEPQPATGLVVADGRIQLASVSAFTPEHPGPADMVRHPRPLLVLVQPADVIFDPRTAASFSLEGLQTTLSAPASGRWAVPLASHDGTPVGWLSWRAERPGSALLLKLAVPLAIVLFVGLALVWLSARNAGAVLRHDRTLHALLDRERELRDLRSRFVATVSHRFRTPLATIQSAADLIGHYRERMSDKELGHEVEAIVRAVDDLKLLIEEATVIDQAENLAIDGGVVAIDVAGRVADLWRELPAERIQGRTLDVVGAARLMADRRLFDLVVGNLLDNAAKFCSSGGRVTATARARPGRRVAIAIADDGVGIPEGEVEQVTDPFTRGSNAGDRQGGGVGLSIVRHTLARIGGNMTIESTPGKGTRVTVDLPAGGTGFDAETKQAAQ
jgi:signal transduction histidine kinase